MRYLFGDCLLDTETRILTVAGDERHVEPQVFDLLGCLAEFSGVVVEKNELVRRIWGGRAISDATISTAVSGARRAVGDDGRAQRIIRTVHGRGFRLATGVAVEKSAAPSDKCRASVRSTDLPSIAVLPFEILSAEREDTYLGEGICEDLTTALSRTRWLFVVSYRSAASHRHGDSTPADAAADLGVRYVVRGTVRRAGPRLRMTCSLTDTHAEQHLWSDRFDSDMSDIFKLQDAITGRIATALGSEITLAEIERARSAKPIESSAYSHYLRALALMHAIDADSNSLARRALETALESDPTFALAHAALTWCHVHDAVHGWSRPGSIALNRALHHASLAVRYDVTEARAHCTMALVHFWSGSHDEAVRSAEIALDLDPNFADAHGLRGNALAISGRPVEGRAALESAKRCSPRDPLLWFWTHGLANAAFAEGNYDVALHWSQLTSQLRPRWAFAYLVAASSAALSGETHKASAAMDRLLDEIPDYTIDRLRRRTVWTREEDIERLVTGLRLAGLETGPRLHTGVSSSTAVLSGQ